jgi:hypothetical protein
METRVFYVHSETVFRPEEYRLLGCDAVWLLLQPTLGGTYSNHHQGGKNRRDRNVSSN